MRVLSNMNLLTVDDCEDIYARAYYGVVKLKPLQLYNRLLAGNGIATYICSSAYKRMYRIVWVDDDCCIQVINNISWGRERVGLDMFKYVYADIEPDEYIKNILQRFDQYGIDPEMFLDNYLTNGYNSAQIVRIICRAGDSLTHKGLAPYIQSMQSANYRHKCTDYDLIDKSRLSDEQVREVRRAHTQLEH